MVRLSIPFTKDGNMLSLVKEKHLEHIEEIYMPLPMGVFSSCRPYSKEEAEEYGANYESHIAEAKSKGIKVNIIANGQFLDVETSRKKAIKLVKIIQELKAKYDIDKITFSSFYIISQYGTVFRDMGLDVELSIIADIDTVESAEQAIEMAKSVNSICLGDQFAHNVDGIKYLKEKYPNISFKLIPNHGCFVNCAGRHQHHHYCSLEDIEAHDEETYTMRDDLYKMREKSATCRSCISTRKLNDISVIRPEDIYLYDNAVDIFKISGREHRAEDILRVIDSYINNHYDGFLDDLLDMSMLSDTDNIQNRHIPKEFGEKRSNCNHLCFKCGYCTVIHDLLKGEVQCNK